MASARPSPKHEAWRWSDHAALAELWPVRPQDALVVPAGERTARTIVVDSASEVHDLTLTLERGAEAKVHLLNLSARYGRVALDVTLHEGAKFALGAALIGGAGANLELVTRVHHVAPGGASRQLVRAVAGAGATTSFLGQVAVARGAQKTDAEQSFRAMLLDRTATANAKPELEIFADDVKCAHGAAIGELDRQALFYLASRGLPPAQARTILLQAFLAAAFADAADRETLEARALAALEMLA